MTDDPRRIVVGIDATVQNFSVALNVARYAHMNPPEWHSPETGRKSGIIHQVDNLWFSIRATPDGFTVTEFDPYAAPQLVTAKEIV